MTFEAFVDTTLAAWSDYLSNVDALDILGRLDNGGGIVLFPTLLLCTRTPKHYVAELVGARRGFDNLSRKTQRAVSTEDYFGQFHVETCDPVIRLNGERQHLIRLTLSQDLTIQNVQERFPFAGIYPSTLRRTGGSGSPLSFGNGFRSAMFDNCMILNQYRQAVRAKHVLNATVIAPDLTLSAYETWLREVHARPEVSGVHTCDRGRSQDHSLAGQFANLYLSASVRETTIGEFLRDHPDVIQRALGTARYVYEPFLRWVDGVGHGVDEAVNPDLLVRRPDGDWDIYDLKTAMLDRESITKGQMRRQRFIDKVEEGVAQLAHYREYFATPKNRQYALDKYGVAVHNPRLTLVVGTFENVRPEEVRQACRRLRDITLVDFDSLLQLFLSQHRDVSRKTLAEQHGSAN